MGVVNTTYTFTSTDTITSAKLNNIIDQTTFTSDALSGTTLQVVSGKLAVKNGGITSNELGTDSVITSKILNGNVTPDKLSTGAPSWSGTTTTMLPAIELGGSIMTNGSSYIDFHSVYPLTDYEARVVRDSGTNGAFRIQQNGTGGIIVTSSSGVTFGSAVMATPAGSAPLFGVRGFASVEIGSATRTIAAGSKNIATATRTSSTETAITFTTAMADANYIVVGTYANDDTYSSTISAFDKTTSGFSLRHVDDVDGRYVQFIVVG